MLTHADIIQNKSQTYWFGYFLVRLAQTLFNKHKIYNVNKIYNVKEKKNNHQKQSATTTALQSLI